MQTYNHCTYNHCTYNHCTQLTLLSPMPRCLSKAISIMLHDRSRPYTDTLYVYKLYTHQTKYSVNDETQVFVCHYKCNLLCAHNNVHIIKYTNIKKHIYCIHKYVLMHDECNMLMLCDTTEKTDARAVCCSLY